MEFLFELIVELIFDSSLSIIGNKKVNKFVRYSLLSIIILFFAIIILGLLFLGLLLLNKSLISSILVILTSLILLIGSILKLRNIFLNFRK